MHLYWALCLLALGRSSEADAAIARSIEADPLGLPRLRPPAPGGGADLEIHAGNAGRTACTFTIGRTDRHPGVRIAAHESARVCTAPPPCIPSVPIPESPERRSAVCGYRTALGVTFARSLSEIVEVQVAALVWG